MTFYPENGRNSKETFSTSQGAEFDNSSLQEIAEGFVRLKSIRTGVASYVNSWNVNINWDIANGVSNTTEAEEDFNIFTGDFGSGVTNAGFAGISAGATAWRIASSLPDTGADGEYTGRAHYGLALEPTGPNTILSDSYASGSQATTFEFDVSVVEDYYSAYAITGFQIGNTSLSGFSNTGFSLSGLPALSGEVSHGLYFSNGIYWDYIEVTRDGIRSANHPELAIPINLLSPKKIRIGFKNNDLYMATSDGQSIAGYGRFDTALQGLGAHYGSGIAIFGAPSPDAVSTYAEHEGLGNIKAVVGITYWDNIKVDVYDMTMFSSTGIDQSFTTSTATMYTASFDPGVYLTQFLYSTIQYAPFNGGETIVSAQYSGESAWTTFGSVTLTPDVRSKDLDLAAMPVFSYGRQDGDSSYFANPIRFKIDQRSYSGNFLPPAVDSIEVFATDSNLKIDLLPDWKHINSQAIVDFYVQTGSFLSTSPTPELWSSLLLNMPNETGIITTSIPDDSNSLVASIQGTGEIVKSGPFNKSFKNFIDAAKAAQSGSEAEGYLGNQPVYNFFPNPLFSEGFRPIVLGEPNFLSGQTVGNIASNLSILADYTGSHNVLYTDIEVYRPETQARVSRINSYLGRTSSPSEEFAQSVTVYPGNDHDGTVGIEAEVPSGVAVGDLKVTFDLQIAQGDSLDVTLSGSSEKTYLLPGEYFRDYRTVSFPTTTATNDKFKVKFAITSGNLGDLYAFNLDNLTVSSLETSYLEQTGIEGYIHNTGVATSTGTPFKAPDLTSTIFTTSIYLYSYPETQGTLFSITGDNGKGLDLSIDATGYIRATIDTIAGARRTGGGGGPLAYDTLPQEEVVSSNQIPLGKWTSIGFMHDVHNFYDYQSATITPSSIYNFASTNKAVIAIDGAIVASQDLMTGWRQGTAQNFPYGSFVELSGNSTATVASGILCEIDGIHLIRSPVGDVESELSIKGARSYVPYFVPDQLYKGNDEENNLLVVGYPTGSDTMVGSCYNFSSPGYLNWDRGPLRNHLVFSGLALAETNSPYDDDIYSTRLLNGAKASAKYSSSFERLVNSTGQLGINDSSWTLFGQGAIQTFGWIYPRETGVFFTAFQGNTGQSYNKLTLGINTNLDLEINKYGSSGTAVLTETGHAVEMSEWNFLKFKFTSTGHLSDLDNTNVQIYLADNASNSLSTYSTGIDYGFRYQNNSEITFGGECDANFFNWCVNIPNSGDSFLRENLSQSTSKGGRYQALLRDNQLFEAPIEYAGYKGGKVLLGPGVTGEDYYFGVALHNAYDLHPPLQGIVAYDDKPFREVNAYNLNYDTSSMEAAFGTDQSPIRVGRAVPEVGINLAKYSAPTFNVASSIAVLDLSDRNLHNVVTYRHGSYEVSNADLIVSSEVLDYRGINSGVYSGRADITFSGKVVSSDLELSTLPITDISNNVFDKAYYYYLIGRGDRVVSIPNAFPHSSNQILDDTTGESVDNYIANLEKVKSSISIKDEKGKEINKQAFPYDVLVSPFTPDLLTSSVRSGEDISIDGLGVDLTGDQLPDSQFSVLLITSKNRLPGQSVFVHYNAYDIVSNEEKLGYKEVVNPQPVFRKRQQEESASVGLFDVSLNQSRYYDLKLYSIASEFTGQI
jgi:hypothetical protein